MPEQKACLLVNVSKEVNSVDPDQTARMIFKHYKRVGYRMDILRQSACLVVHPITVYGYGFLFSLIA